MPGPGSGLRVTGGWVEAGAALPSAPFFCGMIVAFTRELAAGAGAPGAAPVTSKNYLARS